MESVIIGNRLYPIEIQYIIYIYNMYIKVDAIKSYGVGAFHP